MLQNLSHLSLETLFKKSSTWNYLLFRIWKTFKGTWLMKISQGKHLWEKEISTICMVKSGFWEVFPRLIVHSIKKNPISRELQIALANFWSEETSKDQLDPSYCIALPENQNWTNDLFLSFFWESLILLNFILKKIEIFHVNFFGGQSSCLRLAKSHYDEVFFFAQKVKKCRLLSLDIQTYWQNIFCLKMILNQLIIPDQNII